MGSATSAQTRWIFKGAFDDFEAILNKSNPAAAIAFQSTSLQDVLTAVQKIENQLAARQCLRNMCRLKPFFEGLACYSKAVGVLCNGTPYLPLIWVSKPLLFENSILTALEGAHYPDTSGERTTTTSYLYAALNHKLACIRLLKCARRLSINL